MEVQGGVVAGLLAAAPEYERTPTAIKGKLSQIRQKHRELVLGSGDWNKNAVYNYLNQLPADRDLMYRLLNLTRSDQDGNPCSGPTDAPERTKDAGAAEGESAPSCQSSQITPSSSECAGSRTAPIVYTPERYPSIVAVVPPTPWTRGRVTRATTRAAAATCKKRLRSSQDGDNHRHPDASFHDAEQPRQKKKPRLELRSPSTRLGDSIPALCDCHHDVYEIRGTAILTVESGSGLKPAYYLTYAPDANPLPSQPPPSGI